jgi:hypothetical protein
MPETPLLLLVGNLRAYQGVHDENGDPPDAGLRQARFQAPSSRLPARSTEPILHAQNWGAHNAHGRAFQKILARWGCRDVQGSRAIVAGDANARSQCGI